jgi:SpoIID/LytB domain protein
VVIGKDFHWQRTENQKCAGSLKIIVEKGQLTAINIVGVEDYLLSVISSEMCAKASEEFLKAHAVISRSWVMAQIGATRGADHVAVPEGICSTPSVVTHVDSMMSHAESRMECNEHEIMKWYDHQDHRHFDVCADDHCQRYQGLTRATGSTVRKVIDQTWGQVLTYEGELCDARFSKCCGGRMETFSTCWEDKDHAYLQPLADAAGHDDEAECFCNTQDKAILEQVLNNYDQETVDFYRWTEVYDKSELSALIARRSGVEVGEIHSIEPLERGESGRIWKLKIVGSLSTLIVGKELEIRRILSGSHLKSSAFEVSIKDDKVILEGKGWGHGVGLCQIGAAVMSTKGYTYDQILQHYYPDSTLSK